ncbi:MAG: type II secretion system protein [Candidatus Saccharimonas sp.]
MNRSLRDAFTIVEVLVVTVIMVILLTLSVVVMSGQQKVARDNERKSDAENIARGLERYYNTVAKPSVGVVGRYPDRATAIYDIVQNNVLPGVDKTNFYFTFHTTPTNFVVANDSTGTTPSDDTVAQAAVQTLTTTNTIYYVPEVWSSSNNRWELCGTDESCTRFSLYYRTENNVVHEISSRQQQ